MANVTSAHFARWELDPASGEKRRHEIWVKGASKMRQTIEASDFDTADNGEMLVTLRNYNGVYTAWIEPSKRVRGMQSEMSYLDLFVGGQGLTSILEANAYMVESVSPGALPDGDQATVIELRHMHGGKAVVVVDARSNLVTQWHEYDPTGTLTSLPRAEQKRRG